jgi:periplasmic protein TonB
MKWLFSALALAGPAAALAQSAPVPLAPERWVSTTETLCWDHHCYAEGSLRFALTVSPAGRVTGCEIIESSGDARLDEQSCRFLTRRARFAPARDKRGKAVEGRFESRISWKVPGAPPKAGDTAN